MISRSSAKLISEIYRDLFSYREIRKDYIGNMIEVYKGKYQELYDFLYERDYVSWFMDMMKSRALSSSKSIADIIKKLHTGEAIPWNLESLSERKIETGQQILLKLAEDIIHEFNNKNVTKNLIKSLELDGYIWTGTKLSFSESDVLDTEEAKGILESLIDKLNLSNNNVTLYHLKESESQYMNGKWSVSISESRKFLESILQGIVSKHNNDIASITINIDIKKAFEVRNYLKDMGLITEKEKVALKEIYGLLSETGGHPYIANNDEARLMRYLALTFSQFFLLKFKGFLAK